MDRQGRVVIDWRTVKIEVEEIDHLIPYPGNARQGAIADLEESLLENDQFLPLLVQASSNYILSGNQTCRAAQQLGWTQVAVIRLDVDDRRAKKIVLAANRLAELGSFNQRLLAELITSGLEEDEEFLEGTGYRKEDVDALLAQSVEEADNSAAGTPSISAMLDRIDPPDEDQHPFGARKSLENQEDLQEFVVFRLGELRAKVPRSAYERLFRDLGKLHGDDAELMGVDLAIRLGLQPQDVLPMAAGERERWL